MSRLLIGAFFMLFQLTTSWGQMQVEVERRTFRTFGFGSNEAYDSVEVLSFRTPANPQVGDQMTVQFQQEVFDTVISGGDPIGALRKIAAVDTSSQGGIVAYHLDSTATVGDLFEVATSGEGLGAYSSFWRSHFWFDLRNGRLLFPRDLFTPEGWYAFLQRYWMSACRLAVGESALCLGEAPNIGGWCGLKCWTPDISLCGTDSIGIWARDCLPHVAQGCNPIVSRTIAWSDVLEFLSEDGRRIVSSSPSPVGSESKATPEHHQGSDTTYFLLGEYTYTPQFLAPTTEQLHVTLTVSSDGTADGFLDFVHTGIQVHVRGTFENDSLVVSGSSALGFVKVSLEGRAERNTWDKGRSFSRVSGEFIVDSDGMTSPQNQVELLPLTYRMH